MATARPRGRPFGGATAPGFVGIAARYYPEAGQTDANLDLVFGPV